MDKLKQIIPIQDLKVQKEQDLKRTIEPFTKLPNISSKMSLGQINQMSQ